MHSVKMDSLIQNRERQYGMDYGEMCIISVKQDFDMDLCAHRNDRLNIFLRLLWFLIFMAPTKLSFLWPANPGPPMLT